MDPTNQTPVPTEAQKTKNLLFKALDIAVGDSPDESKLDQQASPPPEIVSESQDDVSLSDMLRSGALSKADKKEEPKPIAEPVPPVVAPKETPPAAPEVKPEPPKVELKKIETPPVQADDSDPAYVPPTDTIDLGNLSDLNEDELEEVNLAKYAERTNPARYKGRAAAVLKYIRDHKKLVGELSQEGGDEDITDNPKYTRFVKANKPDFTPTERQRLYGSKIKEEARAEAEQALEKKYKKTHDELRQLKVRPAIERSVKEFDSQVESIMPKDAEDPMVSDVVSDIRSKAKVAAEEFLAVSTQTKAYDHSNEVHKFLASFVEEQGQLFAKSKAPSLKRGTQTFMPRAQFNGLPAKERANHWTFSDEEVLHLLAVNAKLIAEKQVETQRAHFDRMGYVRKAPKAAAPAPVVEAPVVEERSPRANLGTNSSFAPVPDGKKKDPMLAFLNTNAGFSA